MQLGVRGGGYITLNHVIVIRPNDINFCLICTPTPKAGHPPQGECLIMHWSRRSAARVCELVTFLELVVDLLSRPALKLSNEQSAMIKLQSSLCLFDSFSLLNACHLRRESLKVS